MIKWLIMIPYGIMMSGPFAVWGTIGGFVLGLVLGFIARAWLF